MHKSIPERINAIVIVLERLATDVEILHKGAGALEASLPQKFDTQRQLLAAQASALERISISLGMVQHTVASLEEFRDHVQVIMDETETLLLVKNGLDLLLASRDHPEGWQPVMLKQAMHRLGQSIEKIHIAAASLTEEKPVCVNPQQRYSNAKTLKIT